MCLVWEFSENIALTDSSGASDRLLLALTALALVPIVLWDLSGLDLAMARLAGDAAGFALRDNRLLVLGLHEIPRFLGMLGVVA